MAVSYAAESESLEWDTPGYYNIPAVIELHVDAFGDRVALRFRDTDGGHEEWAYGDLRNGMNRFANTLEFMGAGKSDWLTHLLPCDPNVFAVQLAVFKRGALLVPSSSVLKLRNITFRTNDCEATAAVVRESPVGMIDEARDETPLPNSAAFSGDADGWTSFSDFVIGTSAEHDGPALRTKNPMSINYTSGTTGQPKPVRHRHRWMWCFELVGAPYWWGITAGDGLSSELLWTTIDTDWTKWFWGPVGVGLTTGATQPVCHGDLEPDVFLDIMKEGGAIRFCAVPVRYRMFAQCDLGLYDLRPKETLSVGEPLNREPIEAFHKAFGVIPWDGYGRIETAALLTSYPGINMKPDSMGKSMPDLGATIVDKSEEEADVNEIGEIVVPVGCPSIFDDHYERPNLDEKTFSSDYYRTGDLVSRDGDGYFFFEGRTDDIIISAGYYIGPSGVEDTFVPYEAVVGATTVASPHEERGSIVKVFVVLIDDYEDPNDLVGELRSFMKVQTTPYKYPREIEFVAELPETPSRKIHRIELRFREQD